MHTNNKPYLHRLNLKYGINPHQSSAAIFTQKKNHLPFSIINGQPSYINILDALNAWQLVKELDECINLPAAASFKHVSPAGAAVSLDLNETLLKVYNCQKTDISPIATAYIRARGTDPLSSYGDFIGLSRSVDISVAKIIKKNVSDGIIAPEFDDDALKILKEKKGGKYLILKINPQYKPPEIEFREVNGVILSQQRNNTKITKEKILKNILTINANFTPEACLDLLVATISLKYTQSNSVAFAINGQTIGIGAGQQSRLDCIKIAGKKAKTWFLKQHPKMLSLPFKNSVSKIDKINAQTLLLEEDLTDIQIKNIQKLFTKKVSSFTSKEKKEWIGKLTNVSLSSDAFFPFRDSIDYFSKIGVKYIVQPGGSKRDKEVISASNEYGIAMAFSGIRLFHH
tara:strand:- start:182 stop:1381 length:1200 start_codon:yes stop_codon:yes gene_type:complete